MVQILLDLQGLKRLLGPGCFGLLEEGILVEEHQRLEDLIFPHFDRDFL